MPTLDQVSIDRENRLYSFLLPNGGWSCLGFDVVEKRSQRLADWLRKQGVYVLTPESGTPGTHYAYTIYEERVEMARQLWIDRNIKCDIDLDIRLARYYESKERIEILYEGEAPERCYVGKSLGWMPCYILLKTKRSISGGSFYSNGVQSIRGLGIYRR